MSRSVKDVLICTLLDYLAGIHYGYSVAHLGDNAEVMSDEDDGRTYFLLDALHQIQYLCLDRYVQSRRRLVGDQQLRVADESHRDHCALTHSAGELMRILIHALLGVIDAYELEHLNGTRSGLFLRIILVVAGKGFHQLVSDGIHRVEACHRILEDHACLVSPEVPHLLFGIGQEIITVKGDRPAHYLARALEKSHDGVCLHRLSGTGLAYDTHYLMLLEGITDAVNGLDLARRSEE